MNTTKTVVIAVIAVVLVAAAVFYHIDLPKKPLAGMPAALPWTEGVKTEQVSGSFNDINTDDIYYASPTDVWQRAKCVEIKVLIPDPGDPSPEPISFDDKNEASDVKSYAVTDSYGTSTFKRCHCEYRVEWDCTKVSRYVTATAVINGQKYARFIYDRKTWQDDNILRRHLSALVVTCDVDKDCDFYCGNATPPQNEWGIQCEGKAPNRIVPKGTAF